MELDHILTSAVYIVACLAVFIVGHKSFLIFRKDYDIANELVEKDNCALALTLSGYYLGLIIAIGGLIAGPSVGLSEDLVDFAIYGPLIIILLYVSSRINDNFILSRFEIKKEIIEDQNCGTGAVEFAVYIASGLNIYGAVYGLGGSILTTLAFWAMGQAVLVGLGKYYNSIVNYDIHEHIEKDNVAVGVAFAGAIIAIGNLLRAASSEHFVSWTENLEIFAGFMILGLILLPVSRLLTDRILLPGRRLSEELVGQEKPNLGAGFLEASSYIGSSFLISWCL
jgi:uncharacterized membrane protein YjfL (UPF0719 family)